MPPLSRSVSIRDREVCLLWMDVRGRTELLFFLSALVLLILLVGADPRVLTRHEPGFLRMRHHATFATMTVRDVDLVCSLVFVPVSRAMLVMMMDYLPCSCKFGASSPANHFSTLLSVDSMALD